MFEPANGALPPVDWLATEGTFVVCNIFENDATRTAAVLKMTTEIFITNAPP
jgi:hypothetical protein